MKEEREKRGRGRWKGEGGNFASIRPGRGRKGLTAAGRQELLEEGEERPKQRADLLFLEAAPASKVPVPWRKRAQLQVPVSTNAEFAQGTRFPPRHCLLFVPALPTLPTSGGVALLHSAAGSQHRVRRRDLCQWLMSEDFCPFECIAKACLLVAPFHHSELHPNISGHSKYSHSPEVLRFPYFFRRLATSVGALASASINRACPQSCT